MPNLRQICWQTGHLDWAGPAGNSCIWKLFTLQKLRDAPRTDIPPAVTNLECKWVCVCVSNTCFLGCFFSIPIFPFSVLFLMFVLLILFIRIFVRPAVMWRKHFLTSICSTQYRSFSYFNGYKVKQMQLWCFIKIHLCTTSHYTSATAKDIQKHFTEDVESVPVQHSSLFLFFFSYYFSAAQRLFSGCCGDGGMSH